MPTAVAQLAGMPSFLRDLLTSDLAYVALLGVFVLEGAMLMYIMPSEAIVPGSVLLIGGTLAENVAIIVVAVLGATIGQYALFVLAKRGGREYLLGRRWFRVSEARLDRFDGWFDRWGPLIVPVSNALPFTRGMLTVPAGFARMNDREFLVLSALGTLVFETLLAAAAVGLIELF
jgi:membrane protein DedA with SNARE-associated domain